MTVRCGDACVFHTLDSTTVTIWAYGLGRGSGMLLTLNVAFLGPRIEPLLILYTSGNAASTPFKPSFSLLTPPLSHRNKRVNFPVRTKL